VLFIVVPMSVSGLARAQNCADVTVGGYLLDDPRVSCYSPNFRVYQQAGKAMAWVYIAVLFGVVQWLRGNLDFACCEARCGGLRPSAWKDSYFLFLTEAFKPEGFTPRTWEAMAMIRKALLLGLSTGLVFFKDGRMQITAVLLLLSMALAATIVFQPYKMPLLNDLDLLGLFANLAVSFSVSTRVVSAMARGYGVSQVEQLVFDVAALALCTPFMCMWAFMLVDSLLFDGYMEPAFRGWWRSKASWVLEGCTALCCRRWTVTRRIVGRIMCRGRGGQAGPPVSSKGGGEEAEASALPGAPREDEVINPLAGSAPGQGGDLDAPATPSASNGGSHGQEEAKVAFPASSPSISHRGEGAGI
jgi:hypothetical protein